MCCSTSSLAPLLGGFSVVLFTISLSLPWYLVYWDGNGAFIAQYWVHMIQFDGGCTSIDSCADYAEYWANNLTDVGAGAFEDVTFNWWEEFENADQMQGIFLTALFCTLGATVCAIGATLFFCASNCINFPCFRWVSRLSKSIAVIGVIVAIMLTLVATLYFLTLPEAYNTEVQNYCVAVYGSAAPTDPSSQRWVKLGKMVIPRDMYPPVPSPSDISTLGCCESFMGQTDDGARFGPGPGWLAALLAIFPLIAATFLAVWDFGVPLFVG
eukprot:TRINITY_DN3807_c0_g1_i1.p1 TRINITY_DN3807_c0_g1~~TRINITY_DN3807_c0_g1_i1.p1  ORF type:complete len:269 (-),score=46.15 TRINITY_DN3807_c0_g1_i1:67-873(-)